MTKEQAIRHYGTQAALARALGIHRAAINGWGEQIPLGRQYQLEVLTQGVLKADRPHVPAVPSAAA
jgi:DNA-binding transcriptional regulator YdaS (Cro superfamily)